MLSHIVTVNMHGFKENNSCNYILNTLRNEVYQTVQSSELFVKKVKKGLMITIGSFLILRPYALPRDDAEVYDVSLPHFFHLSLVLESIVITHCCRVKCHVK